MKNKSFKKQKIKIDIEISGDPKYIKSDGHSINIAYQSILRNMKKVLKGKDPDQVCIIRKDNRKLIVSARFKDDYDKERFTRNIYDITKKMSADSVILIHDAYMSTVRLKKDFDIKKYIDSDEYVRPREDPNRSEVLLACIYMPDGRSDMLSLEYKKISKKNVEFEKKAKWISQKDNFHGGLILPWENISIFH